MKSPLRCPAPPPPRLPLQAQQAQRQVTHTLQGMKDMPHTCATSWLQSQNARPLSHVFRDKLLCWPEEEENDCCAPNQARWSRR